MHRSSLSSSSRSAHGDAPGMSYIIDLIDGARDADRHDLQLQICEFDPSQFTPEMCLRMSQTLQAQKDFLEKVEISAAAERLRTGREVKKGYVRTPIDIKTTKMNMKPFLQWFCANDPIPFNFNARTSVTVKLANGDDRVVNDLGLAGFFNYTLGTPYQKRDALDYFETEDGVPYDKYDMPNVLFTVNAGAITLGPSTVQNRFTLTKQVIASNDNNLPYPGSPDVANLKTISANFPVAKLTSKEDEAIALNQRFTFPNFLSGDMLLLKEGKDGRRIPDPTELGRPFASPSGNGAEFWAKLYGGTSYYVPYDERIYFFPPGIKLLVRYDDMVMFYDTTEEELSFNVPPGSYYIKPGGVDLIPNVFRDSVRNTRITGTLQAVVDTGPVPTPQEVLSLPYQKMLKALAYIENLIYTKESYALAGGGKKTSKPTKRTKIIKYMAKSKKKYHR